MKNRKYIFIIILILFIFLLLFWQLILIYLSIKNNFIEINLNINLNKNVNSTIPRIIHQMWKTNNLLTYPIKNSHYQWKKFYPNYEIKLWTDKDIEELFNLNEYKYLKEIYKTYPYSIQRSDLARLIILHYQGGIYADLDVFPSSTNIDLLLLKNISLLIPRSFSGSSLINHFLISQKSSIIIDYILHQVYQVKFYNRIFLLPYLDVFTTGSIFLTKTIQKYIQLNNNNSNNHLLWIISENDIIKFVKHHQGRSWHSIDGFILNKFDDHPIISLIIIIITFIFIFFIKKYSNFIKNIFSNK